MATEKKNRPDYRNAASEATLPAIKVVRDVSGGTPSMRAAKTTYLPQEVREEDKYYKKRLERTVFFDAYNRTVQSLAGCVFEDAITLGDDVPAAIATHAEDIDLCGNHLDVFAKRLFTDQFEGCAFILVEMAPVVSNVITLAQEQSSGRRPYWVSYKADAVCNWRTARVNGVEQFTQITFEEVSTEPDGDYGEASVIRYRVFRLIKGIVNWSLYRLNKQTSDEKEMFQLESSGTTTLTRIPVAVAGQLGTFPPLLGLAYLNISHWQNVSDQENILHVTRVPMLVRIGAKGDQQEVVIGTSSTLDAPVDGDYKWLEVSENGASAVGRQNILDIENRMGAMGLAALTPQKTEVERTATEVGVDYEATHSELSTMARSLKDAIELALDYHAEYMGQESGGSIELGVKQSNMVLTPQHLQVLFNAVSANKFPQSAFLQVALDLLQQAGVLAEDDVKIADWEKEIDAAAQAAKAQSLREAATVGARGAPQPMRKLINAA